MRAVIAPGASVAFMTSVVIGVWSYNRYPSSGYVCHTSEMETAIMAGRCGVAGCSDRSRIGRGSVAEWFA